MKNDISWISSLDLALEKNNFVLYRQEILPLQLKEEDKHYEVLLNHNFTRSGTWLYHPIGENSCCHYYQWKEHTTFSWEASNEKCCQAHWYLTDVCSRSKEMKRLQGEGWCQWKENCWSWVQTGARKLDSQTCFCYKELYIVSGYVFGGLV